MPVLSVTLDPRAGLGHTEKPWPLFSVAVVGGAAAGSRVGCVLLLETAEATSLLPNVNLFQKQIPLEFYCFIRSMMFTVPAHIIPH